MNISQEVLCHAETWFGYAAVTVCRVRGNEDMKRHLQEIGFVDGAEVHVVSSSASNVIVLVKGARFGLDSKVAQHIMAA